ncbi:hypothetical protein C0J50_20307%2C partial [Xyrichtys novacula]|uniref:Immunoglobulin domain-containing protein n=1 Tax=Xyrichtys novacula TaxID=13765 RepID=A0AAV1EZS4_XYRNO|nr:hypothetical protein C0J50_20307%2C partial [Xyrichtys novacula]
MNFGTVLFLTLWLSLPGGWGETTYLTGRGGGKLKLETGPFNLHGDFQIEWSRRLNGQTEDRTLINCVAKCTSWNGPEDKLYLNTTSGALTLRLLSPADSGHYEGFITEDNNRVHRYDYNVTVQEETPSEVTKNHRHHYALLASVGLPVAVIFGLLVASWQKVKKTKKEKNAYRQSDIFTVWADILTSRTLPRRSRPQNRVKRSIGAFAAWITAITVALSAPVRVSPLIGQGGIHTLNLTVGETRTLSGLVKPNGHFSVLWWFNNGTEDATLVTFDTGESPEYHREKFNLNFNLDPRTGALTIGPLRVEHSGSYHVELTDENHKVQECTYAISVSESQSNKGAPPDSAKTQTSHWVVVMTAVLILLFL